MMGNEETGKWNEVKRTGKKQEQENRNKKRETLEEKHPFFSIFCLTYMLVVVHYYRAVCLLCLHRTTPCIILIFQLAVAIDAHVTFG